MLNQNPAVNKPHPNQGKTEIDMIAEALHGIEDEIMKRYPQRLRALTGHHAIDATGEYMGESMTLNVSDAGEIIAILHSDPETVYSFGPGSNPAMPTTDIHSCPDSAIARLLTLIWHKSISGALATDLVRLEKEHAVIMDFVPHYDHTRKHLS